MAEVTEIGTAQISDIPPDFMPNNDELEQSGEPTAKAPPAKPPKGKNKASAPDGRTFWQKVAAVPAADWGTRACIYVYIEEPVCVTNTWGRKKYARKLEKPILDLEPLKKMYGSFKGWISLNLRKTGTGLGDQIATHEFEIFDPLEPSKIPIKAWANDERNEKWKAIMPPEPPAPSANGNPSLLESIQVYKEIRNDVKDELAPAAASQPATPASVDPWDAAQKILMMRSENPMVDILKQQMADAAKSAEAERQRAFQASESAREREFQLQKQLMEARTNAPQPKGIVDQLVELAGAAEKLEPVKKLFGGIFGGGEGVVRAGRTNGYDMVTQLASTPFAQEVGQGLGMLLGSLAQRAQGANGQPAAAQTPNPPALPARQTNGTRQPNETDASRLTRIEQQIGETLLFEYFLKGNPLDNLATAFAEWFWNGKPEDYLFFKKTGAAEIIRRAKSYPQVMAVIGPKEPAFVEFINDVCAWEPDADDEDEQPAASAARHTDSDVVDLEQEPT